MNDTSTTGLIHRRDTPKRTNTAPASNPAIRTATSSGTCSVGTNTITEIEANNTSPLKINAPFQGRRGLLLMNYQLPKLAPSVTRSVPKNRSPNSAAPLHKRIYGVPAIWVAAIVLF
jgi:hypothetical protein